MVSLGMHLFARVGLYEETGRVAHVVSQLFIFDHLQNSVLKPARI